MKEINASATPPSPPKKEFVENRNQFILSVKPTANTNKIQLKYSKRFSNVKYQGHPTDRFGKLSVRKAFNPL